MVNGTFTDSKTVFVFDQFRCFFDFLGYSGKSGGDGYYSPKYKTVEVLVNKSIDRNRIVFVTLHELAHYLQHQTDPEFRNYDFYHYDTYPFEIEANNFASDYLINYLKHLEKIGYI